jgi:hypothetical protein
MHFMLNQDNQFSILQVLAQSPNYSQRDLAGKLGMRLGKAHLPYLPLKLFNFNL